MLGGKLYVAGGIGDGSEPVAHLDVYDPKTDQWRTLAPLPTPGAASGAMLQGRFFVVVGTATGARAYAYNPATNRWQAKASPDFQGSMVRVTIDGRPHLFMASGTRSALYTP
jgi:N-acetylneuraminic acid mutarotase